MENLGVVVLAGNAKIQRQIRRKKRRNAILRLFRPRFWLASRKEFESRLASKINKDDYIVGENKSLLYLHPDLISQKNMNFLKRVLYFAGKTGDRVYRRNKKGLLEYLSKEGKTSIIMVLSALVESREIDSSRIIVVGPRKQLEREVRLHGMDEINVVEQGRSIGENILKGKEALDGLGYREDYILVVGGDVPMISPGSVTDFIYSAGERGGAPDIFYGMGSRLQMKDFITDHDLDHMGRVGPNHPKKGNLNKFGMPFIDDIGVFGEEGVLIPMMMGNMFLYRSSSVDRSFIDRFYSLRKMVANPLTYPYLIFHWFIPLYRSWKGKMKLSEGEAVFRDRTGIDLKVCAVHPEVALDMDSYSDMRRLSALKFHREGKYRDLELDFKDYMKHRKRAERKIKKVARKKSTSTGK